MSNQFDKQSPQALEAEKCVLGGMILFPTATERGLELLRPEMFYSKAHSTIFSRIEQLVFASTSVDSVTLTDALARHGELDRVGGSDYINMLVSSVITPAHFDEHAKLVEDKATLRRLVELSTDAIDKAYRSPGDVNELINDWQQNAFELGINRIKGKLKQIAPIMDAVIEEFREMQKGNIKLLGVPYGFTDIDAYTLGIQKKDLTIIAGGTSNGKSAFAFDITINNAVIPEESKRKAVAIFECEMSEKSIGKRFASSLSELNANRMQRGRLSKAEFAELEIKIRRIRNAPIYIDETTNINLMEIRAKLRRLMRKRNIELLIVDHLGLINPLHPSDNRNNDIGTITAGLKGIAKDFDLPVMALCQLSRAYQTMGDRKPYLRHLRDSGNIEQDADVVILIHRPKLVGVHKVQLLNGEEIDSENIAEINIAKQRNGPTGITFLKFDSDCVKFRELVQGRQEPPPELPIGEGEEQDYGGV